VWLDAFHYFKAIYYMQFFLDNLAFGINLSRWRKILLDAQLVLSPNDEARLAKLERAYRQYLMTQGIMLSLSFGLFAALLVSHFDEGLEHAVNVYHGLVVTPFLIYSYVDVYNTLKRITLTTNEMI
jgi:hypothetical protein